MGEKEPGVLEQTPEELFQECKSAFSGNLEHGKNRLASIMDDETQKSILAQGIDAYLLHLSGSKNSVADRYLMTQIRAWTTCNDRISVDGQLGKETRPYIQRIELRTEYPEIETLFSGLPNDSRKTVLERFFAVRQDVLREGRYFYDQIDPGIRKKLLVQLVNFTEIGPSYVHKDMVRDIIGAVQEQKNQAIVTDSIAHLHILHHKIEHASSEQKKGLLTDYFLRALRVGDLSGNAQLKQDTILQIGQCVVTRQYTLDEVTTLFGSRISRQVMNLVQDLAAQLPEYDHVIDILSQVTVEENEKVSPALRSDVTRSEYSAYRPSEAANYRRQRDRGRTVPGGIYKLHMPGLAPIMVRTDAGEDRRMKQFFAAYRPSADRQLIVYDFKHSILNTKNTPYEGGYRSAREDKSEQEQSLNKLSMSSFAYASHDTQGNLIITDLQGKMLETITTQTQSQASLVSSGAVSYLQDPEIASHFEAYCLLSEDSDFDPGNKNGYIGRLASFQQKFEKEGVSKDDVVAGRDVASVLLNDLPRLQAKLPTFREIKGHLEAMLAGVVKTTSSGRESTVQARREQQIRQALAGVNELIYQITPQSTEGWGIVGMYGGLPMPGKRVSSSSPLQDYLQIFMNAREYYENDDRWEAAGGFLRNNGLKIIGAVAGMFLAAGLAAPSGGGSVLAYMATVEGILIGSAGALVMSRVGQVVNEGIRQGIHTIAPQYYNGKQVNFSDPTDVEYFLEGKLSGGDFTEGLLFEYLMAAVTQLGIARVASYLSANCGRLAKVKGTGMEKYHRFMSVNKVFFKNGFTRLDYANKRLIVQMMQQAKQAVPKTLGRAVTGESMQEVGDESMDRLAQQAGIPGFSLLISVIRGLQGKTKRGGVSLATSHGLTPREYVQTTRGVEVTMQYEGTASREGLISHLTEQGYEVTIDENNIIQARFQDPNLPENHEVIMRFEPTDIAYTTRVLAADLQLLHPSIQLTHITDASLPVFSLGEVDVKTQTDLIEQLQTQYRSLEQEDGMIRFSDGQQTFLLDPFADTRRLRAMGELATLESTVVLDNLQVVSESDPSVVPLPEIRMRPGVDEETTQRHKNQLNRLQRVRSRQGVETDQIPTESDLETIYDNGALEFDAWEVSYNTRLSNAGIPPITDPTVQEQLWEIHAAEGNEQFLNTRSEAYRKREAAFQEMQDSGAISSDQRRILSDWGYLGARIPSISHPDLTRFTKKKKQLEDEILDNKEEKLKLEKEKRTLENEKNDLVEAKDKLVKEKEKWEEKLLQAQRDKRMKEGELSLAESQYAGFDPLIVSPEKAVLQGKISRLKGEIADLEVDIQRYKVKIYGDGTTQGLEDQVADAELELKKKKKEITDKQEKIDDKDAEEVLLGRDLQKVNQDIDDLGTIKGIQGWGRFFKEACRPKFSGGTYTLELGGISYPIENKVAKILMQFLRWVIAPQNAGDVKQWMARVLVDNIASGLMDDNLYTLFVTRPRYFVLDCVYTIVSLGRTPGNDERGAQGVLPFEGFVFELYSFLHPHRDFQAVEPVGLAIEGASEVAETTEKSVGRLSDKTQQVRDWWNGKKPEPKAKEDEFWDRSAFMNRNEDFMVPLGPTWWSTLGEAMGIDFESSEFTGDEYIDIDGFTSERNQTAALDDLDRDHLEWTTTQKGSGMRLPLPNGQNRLTSVYGHRRSTGHDHEGWDFRAPMKTPVVAVKEGTVVFAGHQDVSRNAKIPDVVVKFFTSVNVDITKGWGNYVIVDHGGGVYSLYAHLSSDSVSVGDVVQKGQKIALSGNSGGEVGVNLPPHLHFEMWENKEQVSPSEYFQLKKTRGGQETKTDTPPPQEEVKGPDPSSQRSTKPSGGSHTTPTSNTTQTQTQKQQGGGKDNDVQPSSGQRAVIFAPKKVD